MQKKTKDKIRKHITDSSNVFVMAHKRIDLDALGCLIGLYYIVNSFDKNCVLIIDKESMDSTTERSIAELINDGIDIKLYTSRDPMEYFTDESLLIMVDVHKRDMVANEELLDKAKKYIILDHHGSDNAIEGALISYIDESYTSASEIIVELLSYYNVKIPEMVASVILGGICVDTNNFTLKTNANTFSVALTLSKWGADIKKVQYLLKENLDEYFDIQRNISNVLILSDVYAVCVCDERIYDREFLAKVASTILTFENIEMSFAIGKTEENVVGISARSIGDVNAGLFMNRLGGGGHKTDAAVQIMDKSIEEVKNKLLDNIKEALIK